jgi:Regulator of ribonuclease activity B
MSIVNTLMENAASSTDVLNSLDSNGDRFAISRDVDFLLRTPSKEKAELVAGFINDYSYGQATVQDDINVLVIINMPVNQPVALCVSGFFACVAQIFSVEFDGWGCVAQSQT